MGTRLLSEYLIKKRYPHLRYVRIHTSGNNKATIYVWNDDLQLPAMEIVNLKRFAAGYLLPHVCYQVKSYEMIQADGVPPTPELPEPVIEAAMSRELNQFRIVGVINEMFPKGNITFNRFDLITGIIHFELHSALPVTEAEKEWIGQYLYEMIPLGAHCEVTYFEGVEPQ